MAMRKRACPVAYRHHGLKTTPITVNRTEQDACRLETIRKHIETTHGCSVSDAVAISMAIAALSREITTGAMQVRLTDFAKVPAAALR